MSSSFLPIFFKGPITSCEYLNDDKILIAYGPYISLIDDSSFEEITKCLALRYRVIHKIVINKKNPNQICIFGQKAFNILSLNEKNQFNSLLDSYIELDDWIFDIYWLHLEQKQTVYLIIILAHNQCLFYNLEKQKIENVSYCDQRCMLYSARVIDLNLENNKNFENILIASGTIYNEVLIWSALKGNIFVNLKGHQGVIFNIEYSYDTNFLFSTSDDRSINVWSLNLDTKDYLRTIINGDLYTRFYGHDARVWKCVCFIYNEIQYLCSIGEDLNCCLWNVNDKKLIYRFDAMRKGSKNIWSLSVNANKLQAITGWADGGLRRFELKHYLSKQEEIESENKLDENFEWKLTNENEKDFIRNIIFLDNHIICCTNLGSLYIIEPNNEKDTNLNQKLLFKSILLCNFSVMSKNLLNKEKRHWCLAIGTLKGFVYLLNLKFADKNSNRKDEITIDCINCVGIEEELSESNASTSTSKTTLQTLGSSKIFNLIWFKYKNRSFLLVCFSLMNGLCHLYEFKDSNQLDLLARLYLPVSKHRWFTSYSIICIKTTHSNDSSSDDSFSENTLEIIYLLAGDKCGNLHLYKIELNKKENIKLELSDDLNDLEEQQNNLKLVKPIQSILNLTKENSPISAIYSKNLSSNDSENDENLNYMIICCCKDGFYRIFEFNNSENLDDFEELDTLKKEEDNSNNIQFQTKKMLKLINKYQINSYIDLIESFIFENDENTENEILKKFKNEDKLTNIESFNLENELKLALSFYGDKFILWNFQLNRALFESRCGGANRSWDYEFTDTFNSAESDNILFRFIYIKNKSIAECRKFLNKNEIERPFIQTKNHLCQTFHGNTITTCKHLLTSKYLLTGAEDTQLIITRIYKFSEAFNLIHQFHLQGHDSVVKCVDYIQINVNEVLLVSAGGKANIKLWKIIYNENLNESNSFSINRVTHLYEFKRKIIKNKNQNCSQTKEKPWLYIDLKSNPDIRFMDVCLFRVNDLNDIILCFACSDGLIRLFRYSIETNKLFLVNKYEYNKCLLCIRHLKLKSLSENIEKSFILSFGTDGCLLFWKFNLTNEEKPQKIENLNQSGINDVDVWTDSDTNKTFIATVGDDTRISLIEIELDSEENLKPSNTTIKLDQAHASSIVGVKFLNKDFISTVSKDQRLVIWKIDYEAKLIKPVNVLFVNVADVSSMDLIKLEEDGNYRFWLAGVGLEIINFKLF